MRNLAIIKDERPQFFGPNADYYEQEYYEVKLANIGLPGIVRLLAALADVMPIEGIARASYKSKRVVDWMVFNRLTQVKGVGPKKARALLDRFGSLRAIGEASINELLEVPGIGMKLALRIKRHLAE